MKINSNEVGLESTTTEVSQTKTSDQVPAAQVSELVSVVSIPATPTTNVSSTTMYKKWPINYEVPTNRFSTTLTSFLREKKPLTWALRKELKDHIVNDLQQYIGLTPPKKILEDAAKALVAKFPYLTEDIGSGF